MAGYKRNTDFFEVRLSPTAKKSRTSDPPPVLTLAPFALHPKVCFSNIKVSSETKSSVLLHNPSDIHAEVQLELTNNLQNIGLQLNCLHFDIRPGCTETVEIRWRPMSVLQSRGKVTIKHLNGTKKFSYISIACTSTESPHPKRGQKKVGSHKTNGGGQPTRVARKPLCFPETQGPATPSRRETYEVLRPTYRVPPIHHTSPTGSLNLTQDDFHPNFKFASSSPHSKQTDPTKRTREPLREFNYNLPSVMKVEKSPIQIKNEEYLASRIKISDSIFEISDRDFERDSLESAVVPPFSPSSINLSFSFSLPSNIHSDRTPQKDLSSEPKSEVQSERKERSFYLTRNATANLTFSNNDSPEIPACFKQNQSSIKLEFSSPTSLNVTPPRLSVNLSQQALSVNTTPSRENCTNLNLNKSNDNFYSICKSETTYFDSTFPIENLSDSNNAEQTQYVSITKIQEPLSFEISPARPVFKRNTKKIGNLKFRKERIGKEEEPVELKSKINEAQSFPALQVGSERFSLYYEPDYLLHPYGVTTIPDPFSRNAIHPRAWLEKLELELIKWLNSLLAPPIKLGSILEGVDVKKLWDQSTASSLKIAPSREAASNDYVLSDGSRMTALRKAAVSLARTDDFQCTMYNIRGKIDTGFLSVKDDINLYHNQGARVKLVQMCMYYNPLWLRIALEVMYDQAIPVHQNNIHQGLVYFLKSYFLSDQGILAKYKSVKSSHPQGPAFIMEMNNFIVLKFLTLVYFLDQAKLKKLIPYDPCLFCKNSPIKESEGMLNEFIKEYLKCVGQFKKTLKGIGYKLEYRQTFLHEFDYGLTSHLDLRDGVRLTRTMETILKDSSYSLKLWTPVTSRVQKIHNVHVAFSAIQNNGHVINGIAPTDIVNGHKERIFSLIWQILHDFLAPMYQTNAKRIQYWWRKQFLKVMITKRIAMKRCVVKVQALVRGFLVRQRIKKMHAAATLIQSKFRANRSVITDKLFVHDRNKYLMLRKNTIKIQRWFRSVLLVRADRKTFNKKKCAVLTIQKWYRNVVTCRVVRNKFLRTVHAVCVIQKAFRNHCCTKAAQQRFILQKESAILIQRYFREYLIMKSCRKLYLQKKNSAIRIQRWFRNIIQLRKDRKRFLLLKRAAVVIQNNFRARFGVTKERREFLLKRKCIVRIQRWYRALVSERKRRHLERFRNAAIRIQARYRGHLARKNLKPQLQQLAKKKQLFQKQSKPGFDLTAIFNNAIAYNKCKNKHSRKLGDLVRTYAEIDLCARFSPVLCRALKECNDFFKLLWNDLDQCFRDGPYLDIFRNGLSLIIKLVKFHETVDFIILKLDLYDGYSILVSLMGKYIEKNVDIFCKVATIIWLLLISPATNTKVKEKIDVMRLNYFHKIIMSKKYKETNKKFIPPCTLDWGYFDKPTEFLSPKTASEEIRKLLLS